MRWLDTWPGWASTSGPRRPSGRCYDVVPDDNPGGLWWPDVGCGDGLHAPLPLLAGEYRQGPFTYRLELRDGGWTFHHDPQGSFGAVDLFDEELTPEREEGAHRRREWLATR